MTKYFIFPILFITMACSSTSTTECTSPECLGEAGSSSVGGASTANGTTGTAPGGGGNSIATGVVAGGSVGTNTTAGSTSTSAPSVGGSSAVSSSTTGGTTSVTTTAVSTGGSSTVATTTVCIPKTCADVVPAWDASTSKLSKPTACGITTDGCGGLLNCGNCVTDGTDSTDCGQAPPVVMGGFDWVSMGLSPTSNICGNRCVKATICAAGFTGWLCPSTIPPIGIIGCTETINPDHAGISKDWCCKP